MFNKTLIGTKLKQDYVECILQGDKAERTGYVQTTQLMHGGTLSVRSGYDTTRRTLSWSVLDRAAFEKIDSLRSGMWGGGYVYFADPSATNLLPHYLSMPVSNAYSRAGFAKFQTTKAIPTPSNSIGLPVEGGRASLYPDAFGYNFTFTFLVPDECSLAVGVKGDTLSLLPTSFSITWGDTAYDIPISTDLSKVFDIYIERNTTSRIATLTMHNPGVQYVDLYGLQITRVPTLSTLASCNRKYPTFSVGRGMTGATLTEPTASETLNAIGTSWEFQTDSIVLQEEEIRRQ
jgi:hypothetical protein